MIWLLPHLCPSPSVSKLDLRHTGRQGKRDNLLQAGRWWVEEPNHTTARQPGPLLIMHYSLIISFYDIDYLIIFLYNTVVMTITPLLCLQER
jgi:hypothetical protein